MGKIITPDLVHNLIAKEKIEKKHRFESVGKIDDCGVSISEKMVVFYVDCGIVVFRAKVQNFGGFVVQTYEQEKYRNDCGKYAEIIAEIKKLRKEWTSGIWLGNRRVD